MKHNPLTKEDFLSDVKDHQLTVVRDDGIHRHIILGKPGTMNREFEILTFPGYLVYVGDMGSFTFRRLPDMFKFFRGEGINTGYWSEKLQAVDKHDGYHGYSEDRFKEAIKEDFEGWFWGELSDEQESQRKEAWEELENEMSYWNCESYDLAVSKALDYTCPITGYTFQDFWEHDLNEYSYYFVWCCYAVQWAIQKYDEEKAKTDVK